MMAGWIDDGSPSFELDWHPQGKVSVVESTPHGIDRSFKKKKGHSF